MQSQRRLKRRLISMCMRISVDQSRSQCGCVWRVPSVMWGANAIITASGIDDTLAHGAKCTEQSFLALRSWMPSLTWPRVAEAAADRRQLSRCTHHVIGIGSTTAYRPVRRLHTASNLARRGQCLYIVLQIRSVAGAILDVTVTPSFPCMQIVMHEVLVVVCVRPARVGAVFDVATCCRRCVRQNSIASHRPERASTSHNQ